MLHPLLSESDSNSTKRKSIKFDFDPHSLDIHDRGTFLRLSGHFLSPGDYFSVTLTAQATELEVKQFHAFPRQAAFGNCELSAEFERAETTGEGEL
jgi:hypothetical protein